MSEPLLSEPKEWSGHWWLPDAEDHRVPGVLRYEPNEGLRLTLIGGWDYRVIQEHAPGVTSVLNELQSWSMVHGEAGHQELTLLNVHVVTARSGFAEMFSGEPESMVLRASTALVGCLLESPDESAFVGCVATVENLTAWSRRPAAVLREEWDEVSQTRRGVIEVPSVDPLSVDVDGVTVKLHTVRYSPGVDDTRHSVTSRIREYCTLEFASDETRTAGEWIKLVASAEDLVSLSAVRACAAMTIRLYLPSDPGAYPEGHPAAARRPQIEVYQNRVLSPDPKAKALTTRDFLFTLDHIPFQQLMQRWLSIDQKLAAARSLILGLRYVTTGYLESRVVSAVAAAEAMSRAFALPPILEAGELRRLRSQVLAAAPEAHKQWLADKLASAEQTLKNRLLDLHRRPGEFMSLLVPDAERWATAAASARNKFAHVGASQHTADELHAVVEVTSAVVLLNFLHELGMTGEQMVEALREHPRLSYAARLGRSVLGPAE